MVKAVVFIFVLPPVNDWLLWRPWRNKSLTD